MKAHCTQRCIHAHLTTRKCPMNGVNNCKIVLGVGSVGLTCGKFNETQARITQGGKHREDCPPGGGGGGSRFFKD